MSLVPQGTPVTIYTGPPFIAIILHWGLYGVLSLQAYLYFQVLPNDRTTLKVLVASVYFLMMAQTILLTQTTWNMLVIGFGNDKVLDIGLSWLPICVMGGVVEIISQWFYAYRIFILSQKKLIPGVIVLISLTALAGALATAVDAAQSKTVPKLVGSNESMTLSLVGLWAGTSGACDVAIAICMCYYLRSRPVIFPQTQALISRVVRMSIETGILTASISLLTLILYFPPSFRQKTYFEVSLSLRAKIYSTTMLAVLNNRASFANGPQTVLWRATEFTCGGMCQRSLDTHAIEFSPASQNEYKEKIISTDEIKGFEFVGRTESQA